MKIKLLFILLLLFFVTISQTTHTVNAGMFYYTPSDLVINQGDIVVWINDGGCHDVNGLVNSITGVSFDNPEEFSSEMTCEEGAEILNYTFNVPGEYNYDCSAYGHASSGMVGAITVNEVDCVDNDLVIEENFGTFSIANCTDLIGFLAASYGYSLDQSCAWNGAPMTNFGGLTISDLCECACQEIINVGIYENDHNIKQPIMIVDFLGRNLSSIILNQPMLIFYNDGSVYKTIITN